MITLLADANIQGHFGRLVARMKSEPWRDFWDYLELQTATFEVTGISPAADDATIWEVCQARGMLLVTNNRNAEGSDSLEAVIQSQNTPECLPIFTLGNADRILSDTDYLDRVIDRLLRYLLELDAVRGAGRLYLP